MLRRSQKAIHLPLGLVLYADGLRQKHVYFPTGGLAAAALAVNNHRDMEHDRLVGRRTFAVVFGAAASRRLYRALLRLLRDFVHCPPGVAFNQILFQTFRLELWFAVLLSVGAVLVRMLR
jgi:1,4-dihydroxy-2-naphthoate octaprenyltransferase